jgi:hypothetical protein
MDINQIEQIKNNPNFTLQIIKKIESEIRRKINNEEEDLVISVVKNLPSVYFNTQTIDNVMRIIKHTIIDEIAKAHSDINNVDIHEILKRTIKKEKDPDEKKINKIPIFETNIDSIFGITDIASLVKQINEPTSSINTAYLLLDTKYRTLENDGTEFFSWCHINNLVRSQGTVNSVGNLKNIITITLMKYRIPAVANAINIYNRITLSIDEITSQSIIAHEDKRFHFMCHVDKHLGNWLEICSDDCFNGEFKFNNPITTLDTITIRFGNPLEPLIFDKDRLQGIITYGNPTIFNFNESHNLYTPDIVYNDTFTTKNSKYDSLIINQITLPAGLVPTILTPTSFSVPVDSSSIVTALTGTINPPSIILGGTVTVTNNSTYITGVGTTFITDFIVGDYIQIQNTTSLPIFQIISIQSNNKLIINTKYNDISGTYTYRKTGLTIIGTGTLFISQLHIGDNIIINDGGTNPEFIVKSIQSQTELTLENPYNGLNGAGFVFSKNNSITNIWNVFFGSKRIFITLEIKYLS